MKNRCNFHLRKDEITAVFIFELCRQTWYSLYMHLRGTVKMVPSRFVRKIVCRPQQNEVSQQWRKTLFAAVGQADFVMWITAQMQDF